MPISASKVFDFLNQDVGFCIVRHEIGLTTFSILRHSLRQIALKLHDSHEHEALEFSGELQVLLSEWLTVPMPFDHSLKNIVTDLFGESDVVQQRWGNDIRKLYDSALHAIDDLIAMENPVREKLREVIREIRSRGEHFKLYCHRRARPYFHSLLVAPEDLPVRDEAYLHSVRDYRETEPFGTLIKVGALRSRGWGSAPDAILTAPRFNTLVQIVWSGCNDEVDFGYDPVSSQTNLLVSDRAIQDTTSPAGCGLVRFRRQVIHSGENDGSIAGFTTDVDELNLFREIRRQGDKRTAILLQIGETLGILYPPHSHILSYDPDLEAQEPIAHRIPGDSFLEGMFLIMPYVDEVNFDGVKAEHGYYSRIWKAKLEQEFQNDANGLIKRLRGAGLNLLYLRNAIHNWCKPPSTVIHAPQLVKHFKILLNVLGITNKDRNGRHLRSVQLWQLAWNEVRRSRGEAIQAGVQAHEIIGEELQETLRKFIPQIRDKALGEVGFKLTIPPEYELHGIVLFFKVNSVEEGFRIPETELKVIRELNEIDRWRE